MYKYFDFKKIFEADESMMPEEGMSPKMAGSITWIPENERG